MLGRQRFKNRQNGGEALGSLPAQSFCGARRMRAPLAPPRRSDWRKVRALSHAVATMSATERPEAAISALSAATS
jgi:DNA primase